jgi:SAM-dependent methyltransferase
MSESAPPSTTPAAEPSTKTKDGLPNSRWLEHWETGIAPGDKWDCKRTEPTFQRAIDAGAFASLVDLAAGEERTPRAMVPGCGRGYAVISLARAGFATLGLDLSTKALDEVRTLAQQVEEPEAQSRVLLQAGDFFALTPESVGGQQDLVYDCTFLCAIPPAMRLQWAAQMAALIRPGGVLVLTVFPVKPDSPQTLEDDTGAGPPFGLSSALVSVLLSPVGFTMTTSSVVSLEDRARPAFGCDDVGEVFEVWTRMV